MSQAKSQQPTGAALARELAAAGPQAGPLQPLFSVTLLAWMS